MFSEIYVDLQVSLVPFAGTVSFSIILASLIPCRAVLVLPIFCLAVNPLLSSNND